MSEYADGTKIKMNVFCEKNQEMMQAVVQSNLVFDNTKEMNPEDVLALVKLALGVLKLEQSDGNNRYIDVDNDPGIKSVIKQIMPFIKFRERLPDVF